VADYQVTTLLNWAMLCFTTAVTGNPNPPENIGLRLDQQVAWDADLYTDLCCEGLGYVSFGDIFPSWEGFPEPSLAAQANRTCPIPAWAVVMRMGIVRCVPSGTDTTMPSQEEWTNTVVQAANDAQALRAAACCFQQMVAAAEDAATPFWGMSATVGQSTQTQIQGGCVERNVEITVQIPNCDCFSAG
jgi:hypothetical protein